VVSKLQHGDSGEVLQGSKNTLEEGRAILIEPGKGSKSYNNGAIEKSP